MNRRALHLAATALVAAAALFTALAPAGAQSPPSTVLQPGPNSGSADSFQGPHDWTFSVKPGTFGLTLTVVSTSQDSAPLSGQPTIRIFCTPKCDKQRVRFVDSPSGVVTIRGTVLQPTKMVARVIPPSSNLVRIARNYTLEASGTVVFASGSGADPIVGTYISKRSTYGPTRFLANGTVVTSDGREGHWVVFDPQLHIYTVTVAGDRMSVKLVPGRGLLEASGDGEVFETAH